MMDVDLVTDINEESGRWLHRANTAGGMSGACCVNHMGQVAGLHEGTVQVVTGGAPTRVNRGVSIIAIRRAQARGGRDLLKLGTSAQGLEFQDPALVKEFYRAGKRLGGEAHAARWRAQVAAAQEVVMTISGGLAEAETSGVIFNAVPREGSNRFTGQGNFSGSNSALQGSNYTQALQDAGLRAPFELINVYDVSAMYGGRIKRDKLWFYGVYRQVGGERTVPGMFYNKNAGNPNSWVVDFDRSSQAFNNSLERQATFRLTWQATPRNKFNLHWSDQYNDANYGPGGGTATTTPEASSRTLYIPSRQPHATWQSPITSRLLAEAGWGMYQARYRFGVRNDDTHNPAMIQRLEQGAGETGIPGLLSRMPRAPASRVANHQSSRKLTAFFMRPQQRVA